MKSVFICWTSEVRIWLFENYRGASRIFQFLGGQKILGWHQNLLMQFVFIPSSVRKKLLLEICILIYIWHNVPTYSERVAVCVTNTCTQKQL